MTLQQAKDMTLDDLLIEAAYSELHQKAAMSMRYEDFNDNYAQVTADIRKELNERRAKQTI